MDTKPTYLSRTLWTNFIIAGLAFFPDISLWVSSHPLTFAIAFGGINMVLRLITKKQITIS